MKWLTGILLGIAVVLGGLLFARQANPGVTGGTALDHPVPLPALKLVDDRGEATTLAHGDGRLRLIFYGFVRCPDVCPATLASLKNSYEELTPPQQQKLQIQFITVDPTFDTPEVVRAYLNRFEPAFTGLTGKADTIDAAARAMFVANVKPQPAMEMDHSAHLAAPAGSGADNAQAAGAGAGEAARIHGDQVSVVDPQGQFVRVYSNLDVIGGALQQDLPGLIRKYGGS
ncbi:SCO family protein [Deinococcus radiopugnans]|uniref:Protein SCO1/2 n=1 Tax=Deinococcus radiopugnans ATCC 19172 TaxID=585398 RepID=A0A5C4Y830_9DEIO|nr:SCO family protein [Deinococcus radiopugnans]MBB6016960.1 protein SCO1/2 [Deinococcus radiopugnans ATCC 19172]TNM71508.1 SCO family protein [Deinococcus radiopugnans ATCC 19172]